MENLSKELLTAIGGQFWSKGIHERIYFNIKDWTINEIDYSKRGYINYCTINGEKISNRYANDLIKSGQFYYDLNQNAFITNQHVGDKIKNHMIDNIMKKLRTTHENG